MVTNGWPSHLGAYELVESKFGRIPLPGKPKLKDSDPELYALVQAWTNQLLEARDTLADIRDDPDGVHPTHATLYFSLATDPQGPRAALEAALTQRGLVKKIIFVSREGLRHMYLARRDYVEAAGEVRDDRENDGIYYDWREHAGVYWSDTDDHRSDSDDCEGMVTETEKLDWLE
jgi:hypothetical protein